MNKKQILREIEIIQKTLTIAPSRYLRKYLGELMHQLKELI